MLWHVARFLFSVLKFVHTLVSALFNFTKQFQCYSTDVTQCHIKMPLLNSIFKCHKNCRSWCHLRFFFHLPLLKTSTAMMKDMAFRYKNILPWMGGSSVRFNHEEQLQPMNSYAKVVFTSQTCRKKVKLIEIAFRYKTLFQSLTS